MSQKHPLNNFDMMKGTSQFSKVFMKNYNEESDKGYFLEVDVQYVEKLHGIHSNLLFLPERMKIEKAEKLIAKLHYKAEYVIHTINLKEALSYGLILKKFIKLLNLIKMLN